MESASARPMSEKKDLRPGAQETLQQVTELLRKQQLVEGLVRRQEGPRQELVENLVQKLHVVELQKYLDKLHPADVADVLEALPPAERLVVWDLVRTDREGEILLEV